MSDSDRKLDMVEYVWEDDGYKEDADSVTSIRIYGVTAEADAIADGIEPNDAKFESELFICPCGFSTSTRLGLRNHRGSQKHAHKMWLRAQTDSGNPWVKIEKSKAVALTELFADVPLRKLFNGYYTPSWFRDFFDETGDLISGAMRDLMQDTELQAVLWDKQCHQPPVEPPTPVLRLLQLIAEHPYEDIPARLRAEFAVQDI